MRSAYAFLADHRDQAFRRPELESILEIDGPAERGTLNAALDALERLLAVQKRIVRKGNYYAFWHEMNTSTWEEDIVGVTR